MQELRLTLPTYKGDLTPSDAAQDSISAFGAPLVPAVIRNAQGLRIVLGTFDYDDISKPDVQIERHPHGWMIFLHPRGGGDPSGSVYFLDDGRSFLQPEFGGGPTEPIKILADGDEIPQFTP